MSPNIENNNKIRESDNSFDEIISELKKLVFDEKRCISYTYISQRFKVHFKTALKILDQFSAEEHNENQLNVNYLLSGNNNNDNEIKMERFKIVKKADIDCEKNWYKNGLTQHIYSVSTLALNDSNDSIELNFDDFDYAITDKSDLQDFQKLTFKMNPNIELRNNMRRRRVIPIQQNNDNCDQIEKNKIKTENESKPKVKTNSKGKRGKNNKISNIFSKSEKKVKKEETDEECDPNNADPFQSDSEEENKTNDEVINIDSNEVFCSDVKNEEQNEEKVMDNNNKEVKNGNKRQSDKRINSSEDEEEIFVTKKKSKSKRYKRVRYVSDSDSDEPKEESAISKFVSTKKENSKPFVKVEEIQETHIDDDGYVVTKTVKKEVILKNNLTKDEKTENNKKESNNSENNKEKSNSKQNKNGEKKPEKKAKPVKEIKSKTQSSITSFFKPKQI